MSTLLQAISQYFRLALMSASTTFIPWMLPLTYAAIIALQLNWANPHGLLFVTVVGAIAGTMILRYWYKFLGPKIKKYIHVWKERKNEKNIDTKIPKKKWWIKQKTHELHQKMHIFNSPHILFGTVFITTLLPIPDLIVIMHVQKKMNTLIFFIATTLWKILNYIPIIYGIEIWQMMF